MQSRKDLIWLAVSEVSAHHDRVQEIKEAHSLHSGRREKDYITGFFLSFHIICFPGLWNRITYIWGRSLPLE